MKVTIDYRNKQKGVVLVISLMILLVLTIIGIASVSNATIEERMATNFHHTTQSFQKAETTISNVINAGTLGAPAYAQANDPLLQAANVGQGNPIGPIADATVDPLAASTYTVTFQGEQADACPGNPVTQESPFICNGYQVTSTASIANSGAATTHIQGLGHVEPR
ncbi:MAG: hypothetical protein HY272_06290 [Gammaproteobacteria bacterium]|nr:hypothetical protein [Gammaproteobacteria bacterium]